MLFFFWKSLKKSGLTVTTRPRATILEALHWNNFTLLFFWVDGKYPQLSIPVQIYAEYRRGGGPGRFLNAWGGGVHENVSQILATIDFPIGEISGKALAVTKNLLCK